MKIISTIVLIFVLFLIAGCSQVDVENIEKIEETGELKEFYVEAFQFGYDPEIIEVNKGDLVRIIANSRDVSHSLTLPEFKVNLFLTPKNDPQIIEFIADKEGSFSFYCNKPCGSGHGRMRGQFIVN